MSSPIFDRQNGARGLPATIATAAAILLCLLPISLLPARQAHASEPTPLPIDQLPSPIAAEILAASHSTQLVEMDNTSARECIDTLTLVYLAFFPGSLTWGPTEMVSEQMIYATDLLLKSCPASFHAPADKTFDANVTDPVTGEPCYRDVPTPTLGGEWENILGVDTKFTPSSWGQLGTPSVYHFNSDVRIELDPPGDILDTNGDLVIDTLRIPVGRNVAEWAAHTQLSLIDQLFIPMPGPAPPSKVTLWNIAKRLRKRALQKLARARKLDRIEDESGLPLKWDNAANLQYQNIVVWDDVPPTLDFAQPMLELIATDPGGAKRRNHEGVIRRNVIARDACDRPVRIGSRGLPEFFEVDREYSITWTASDLGPNRDGEANRVEDGMIIVARDIHPPDLKAPDHIVVISDQEDITIDLGHPQVFDAVDLDPTITNDAPPTFPHGTTVVHWQAIDQSGNRSRIGEQRVNVKPSNLTPSAQDQRGAEAIETLTWEETQITLEGWDPDPQDFLNFEITSTPENGFFHAPLYPAFVEDYRVEAVESGEQLRARCDDLNGSFQYEAPFAASYVAVADDGTTFVVDNGDMFCQFGNLDTSGRIAVFDAQGQLKRRANGEHMSVSWDPAPRGIWTDQRNDRIYVTDSTSGGTSTVTIFDTELNRMLRLRVDVADTPPGQNAITAARRAVADHPRGILYVADFHTVRAFRSDAVVTGGLADEPVLLGTVVAPLGGNAISDLEVDSEGNLFVALANEDRILKYTPSELDPSGLFTPGRELGWMGRCDRQLASTPHAVCDEAARHSIGFACTDELCSADRTSGSGRGQFDTPRGLAMSAQDVLYVTDYENYRIQRFTPDGYFAGEAKSTCDGVCFVLGAFNKPEDITVNSHHFYLLDRETNLLHVSETTPIELFDPDLGRSAFVTYQSDADFVGHDSFEFRVDDGLERSAPARVDIRVRRNQRPPHDSRDLVFDTAEDTPLHIDLDGFDPDGDLLQATVTQPTNGEITRSAERWLYRPHQDFTGEDTFTYSVSDGVHTSVPGQVVVNVLPSADAPTVDVTPDVAAGLGFPVSLEADFTDPDPAELHVATVDWGDGTRSLEQRLGVGTANANSLFMTPALGGGSVVAGHVFQQTGAFETTLCVNDGALIDSEGNKTPGTSSLEGCTSTTFEVARMIDLALHHSLADTLVDSSVTWQVGDTVSYVLTIENRPPEGWNGLVARDPVVTDILPTGVTLESVTTSSGSCHPTAAGYACDLLDLAVGETAQIEAQVEVLRGGQLTISSASVETVQPDALAGNNGRDVEITVGAGLADCPPGRLCLAGGRFEVAVDWTNFQGETGSGTAVPGTDDSGVFWFFDASNWEMMVKVLDGCAINQHHWVLAAATTDVAYTLTVTDTTTGQIATYQNDLGTAAPATIDTNALESCDARPASRATSSSRAILDARTWLSQTTVDAKASSSCADTPSTRCLAGRFRVTIDFRDHQGQAGQASAASFGTPDSGLFWFFDASNWEMMVKVLDGCGLNDRFWVYAAATTDVEYSLHIEDTVTGIVETYDNLAGRAAEAITDTSAFACSP